MKKSFFKKNVLIAGGTGFIGYHLCKAFLEKNYNVISISTKAPIKSRKISGVKYLLCDLVNIKRLRQLILKKNYNIVLNLAGYADHSKKTKTYKSHFIGIKNLTNILLLKKIELFIQIGSGLEYGKKNFSHKESSTCKPLSIYALSKYKATNHILGLFKKYNFPATVIRAYQIYGPGQSNNRLIPQIIISSLKDKKFDCTEGSQIRNFLHIKDFNNFIFKLIERKEKAFGQIFNLGYEKSFKVKFLIKKIIEYIGGGKPIFGSIKMRKDESLKMHPSINKAKKFFKWSPKINLKTGLKNTINFYEKKKFQSKYYN